MPKGKKEFTWREMEMGFVIPRPGSTLDTPTGDWRSEKPLIDYSKCNSCGWCWAYCPEPAISLVDKKYVINYDYCKGCGICATECPLKCIQMLIEE